MSGNDFTEKIKPGDIRVLFSYKPGMGRLDIELTERCDNNCIHCSINIPEKSPMIEKELTTGEWKKIISESADLGVLSIRFTGGEPLLREDFEEIYTFTRKQGIKVILFTNARKITRRIAELLEKIPPLEKIEVSVYGMSRESYEKVTRVKGSYDEFRAGVDLLLEYNIPFVVKGIMLRDNVEDREKFIRWAESLPGMAQAPSFSSAFELRERRDNNIRNEQIRSLRMDPGDKLRIAKVPERDFVRNYLFLPGKALFSCGAGESLSVDAYGMAHPCLTLKAEEFSYDVKKGTLKDAYFRFFPEKLQIMATDQRYLKRCARCFLKSMCLQCPSRSWSEYGTLDTPVEYYCDLTHNDALAAGLLKDDEKGWEVADWKERVENYKESEDAQD